jgi:hypothetical protein
MTLWWAAVLSSDHPEPSMSMMWLDRRGQMLGRVLCVTGVPLEPTHGAMRALQNVHDAVVGQGPEDVGHLALALSRSGVSETSEGDDEWADALHDHLDDLFDGTWSLHVVAGGWITRGGAARVALGTPWTAYRPAVTRNGSPVAVILAVEDYESLMETLGVLSDPEAVAEIRQAESQMREGEG